MNIRFGAALVDHISRYGKEIHFKVRLTEKELIAVKPIVDSFDFIERKMAYQVPEGTDVLPKEIKVTLGLKEDGSLMLIAGHRKRDDVWVFSNEGGLRHTAVDEATSKLLLDALAKDLSALSRKLLAGV